VYKTSCSGAGMNNNISKLSVRLLFKGLKLVTVESCTGGWIGKIATDYAGSSCWFEAGFITYSNQAKHQLVSVPLELIEKYGAVSLEVADAMAKGALLSFPDCISVAVTGVAGPDGGTESKPVGTVCIASAYKNKIKARKFIFSGNRNDVREQTVSQAIEMLLSMEALA
jgi:nicotinamide-nucleotide amidase